MYANVKISWSKYTHVTVFFLPNLYIMHWSALAIVFFALGPIM